MEKIASILVVSLLLISCRSTKIMNEQQVWVNSHKVTCEGVGPMSCLQIQKGETFNPGNWQFFYGQIEGFDYRPGNIYKLKVKVDSLDAAMLTADASTLKYTLVEVLEEKPDTRLRVNDIWILTHLKREELQLKDTKQPPYLEILVAENRIAGKGFCNRFFGTIKQLTETEISFNEGTGSTRMACRDMEMEDIYFKALSATHSYSIKDANLILSDSEGKEILKFKKTD